MTTNANEFSNAVDYSVTCFAYAFNFVAVWFFVNAMVTNFWWSLFVLGALSLFIGMPLVHLEQVVGFLADTAIVHALARMIPLFQGLSYSIWLVSLAWSVLVCRQASLSLFYFTNTVANGFNYTTCGHEYNIEQTCHSPLDVQWCTELLGAPAEYKFGTCQFKEDEESYDFFSLFMGDPPKSPGALEYFSGKMLTVDKPTPELMIKIALAGTRPAKPSSFNIALWPTVAVIVTAIVAFICVCGGPRVFGKLSYATVLIPVILLTTLNVLLTIDDNIDFHRPPIDRSSMLLPYNHTDTGSLIRMVLIASGAMAGVFVSLASATRRRLTSSSLIRTPFLVVLAVPLLVLLMRRPVQFALGVHEDVDVNVTKILENFASVGIAFEDVFMPSAFAVLPQGVLYASLFYAAVFIAQLGTLVPLLWTVSNAFLDVPKCVGHRFVVTLGVCAVVGILAACLNTGMGHGIAYKCEIGYVVTAAVCGVFFTGVVNLRYGWYNIQQDLSLLLGVSAQSSCLHRAFQPPSPFFVFAWLGVLPITLVFCALKDIVYDYGLQQDLLMFAIEPPVTMLAVLLFLVLMAKIRGKSVQSLTSATAAYTAHLHDGLSAWASAQQHVIVYDAPLDSPRVCWCCCTYYPIAGVTVFVLEFIELFVQIGVAVYLFVTDRLEDNASNITLICVQCVVTLLVLFLLLVAMKKQFGRLLLPFLMRAMVSTGAVLAAVHSKLSQNPDNLDDQGELRPPATALVVVIGAVALRAWCMCLVVGVHWAIRQMQPNDTGHTQLRLVKGQNTRNKQWSGVYRYIDDDDQDHIHVDVRTTRPTHV